MAHQRGRHQDDRVYMAVDTTRAEDYRSHHAIYISNDGRRQTHQTVQEQHKRQKITPATLQDDLADWIPADDVDEGYGNEGQSATEVNDVNLAAGDKGTGEKRKQYLSSVS